jgi:hypothetical protein
MRSLFLALALMPAAALASGPGDTIHEGVVDVSKGLSYAVFEATVEHADLATCPVEFDSEKQFCRLTIAADAAHVFVFAYEGDQFLQAVKTYELGNGFLPF